MNIAYVDTSVLTASTATVQSSPRRSSPSSARRSRRSGAKLESLHGDETGEQILGDLCKWMDIHGSLATWRHGFKCYGRTLHAAYFKAAHELNPELEARYAANHLGLTRQLHFSPRSEQSLDVTLSLNGIPVATLELKNPLTGQRVSFAESTGVLPVLTTCFGPRTELAGLKGRTWPTTSQSNSIRSAARCCFTLAGESAPESCSMYRPRPPWARPGRGRRRGVRHHSAKRRTAAR